MQSSLKFVIWISLNPNWVQKKCHGGCTVFLQELGHSLIDEYITILCFQKQSVKLALSLFWKLGGKQQRVANKPAVSRCQICTRKDAIKTSYICSLCSRRACASHSGVVNNSVSAIQLALDHQSTIIASLLYIVSLGVLLHYLVGCQYAEI